MLGHPAIILCPALHMMLLHPADPILEVTAAALAGRHRHLEGTSGPFSLRSSVSHTGWENGPGCGRKGALLDRETEAQGSFCLCGGTANSDQGF